MHRYVSVVSRFAWCCRVEWERTAERQIECLLDLSTLKVLSRDTVFGFNQRSNLYPRLNQPPGPFGDENEDSEICDPA